MPFYVHIVMLEEGLHMETTLYEGMYIYVHVSSDCAVCGLLHVTLIWINFELNVSDLVLQKCI